MKKPLPLGRRITATRMRGWLNSFEGYRVAISQGTIDRWIDQFEQNDKDLAARILDSVDFINTLRIQSAFRNILNSLTGWNIDENRRQGKWRFVPFSGSSGSSADSMIHLFRMANGLSHRQFNKLFIYRSDLLSESYGEEDTIVFIDDFAGTGEQACDSWREFFNEIVPYEPTKILILVAISDKAFKKIQTETELVVYHDIILTDSDNIFHNRCRHFSKKEKEALLEYCQRADSKNPCGYGNCGYVIVFPQRCPNNSVPILHVTKSRWHGLFPRHD